jgi:hypothetical protein
MTPSEFFDEFGEMQKIVSDLAAREPIGREGHCELCFEQPNHDPACPWLRAVEITRRHRTTP